ncbi:MAG: amidohydrolase family protein [Acidobacteriia bacterium]|nr:amidohydrolase family protein [Terriglobia bacterium]
MSTQASQTKRTLIRNGTIIDGTGKPPLKNASVLVEGDKIVAVGADVKADASARVIDAAGKTIMPALIDGHCHISYGDVRTQEESDICASREYRAIRAVWNAQKVLRAGVTSICDPGSTCMVSVAVRDAIYSGMFEGPRIFAAGPFLTSYNGIADYFPTWVNVPTGIGVLTNTLPEMITEVRKQVKEGADLIKVAASGDISNPTAGADTSSLSLEELTAVAKEVHRLGRRVTAHARAGLSAADCSRAGFDWVMHGTLMTDEHLDVLLANKTPLMPSLTYLTNAVEFGKDCSLPQSMIDGCKWELDRAIPILSKAHKAGLPLLIGSESGFALIPYGHWHARELETYVKYLGFTPMEAIVAATKLNAITVDLAGQIGTIEPGTLADVLVVDGDPLADISVLQDLRKILVVMKAGELVDLDRPWPTKKDWSFEQTITFGWRLAENPAVRALSTGSKRSGEVAA